MPEIERRKRSHAGKNWEFTPLKKKGIHCGKAQILRYLLRSFLFLFIVFLLFLVFHELLLLFLIPWPVGGEENKYRVTDLLLLVLL